MSNEFTLQIDLLRKPKYDIGDRLWIVEALTGNGKDILFTEPCPACKGTKQVTVNGITMRCGYCLPYNPQQGKTATCMRLNDWVVREYVVNAYLIEGPNRKNAYEKNDMRDLRDLPWIKEIRAFSRTGNSQITINTKRVDTMSYTDPQQVDTALSDYEEAPHLKREMCFRTKAEATRFAAGLKAIDAARLEKFNQEHGSGYVYPW